jgi:hypothetical protein
VQDKQPKKQADGRDAQTIDEGWNCLWPKDGSALRFDIDLNRWEFVYIEPQLQKRFRAIGSLSKHGRSKTMKCKVELFILV